MDAQKETGIAEKESDLYKDTITFMQLTYGEIDLTPQEAKNCRSKNGSTPLVRACLHGFSDIVLQLLDKYHADIEEIGCVTLPNLNHIPQRHSISAKLAKEIEEYFTPLQCAARYGHLNIVQILIQNNALVNVVTKGTALIAACTGGSLSVVKYLVEHGADINIAVGGITCFQRVIEGNHFSIAEYLLQNGCDINITYLNSISTVEYCVRYNKIDFIKLILQFDTKSYSSILHIAALHGQDSIVEYVLRNCTHSKLEEIDTLELLGSSHLLQLPLGYGLFTSESIKYGLQLWERALELRHETELPSVKNTKSQLSTIMHAVEINTIEELRTLYENVSEIERQCLIIRERILGSDDLVCLRHILNICKRNENSDQCLRIELYYLMQPSRLNYESFSKSFIERVYSKPREELIMYIKDMISVIRNGVQYLELILKEVPKDLEENLRDHYDKIFKLVMLGKQKRLNHFECCRKLMEFYRQPLTEELDLSHYKAIIIKLLSLIQLLIDLKSHCTVEEVSELKSITSSFIKLRPLGCKGRTVLHIACSVVELNSNVIEFLLKVGANPNSTDSDNNTPLHVAAMNHTTESSVAQILLEHGAHLDYFNFDGKTPLQLMSDSVLSSIHPSNYLNLQCLCAKAIQSYGLQCYNVVPNGIGMFLSAHQCVILDSDSRQKRYVDLEPCDLRDSIQVEVDKLFDTQFPLYA